MSLRTDWSVTLLVLFLVDAFGRGLSSMRNIVGNCSAAFLLAACIPISGEVDAAGESLYVARLAKRLSTAENDGASGILRVSSEGEVVFESGFGSASCSSVEQVTSSHVFMIGSITKEFTRVLGFVLEEKGYLSFGRTVKDYFPGFRGQIGRVTIGQLLHHTGGLPDLIDEAGEPVSYTVAYDYIPVDRDELLARVELAKLIFEPDEREEYSNLGFQLLAMVYEAVTDESYQDLLQHYVFEPAGMTGTSFWFEDNAKRTFADGCRAGSLRWGNPIDDTLWDSSGPSWNLIGAGGLLSTAESLSQFFDGIGDGVYFESPDQSEKYKADRMVYSESREQRVMGPAGSNGIFNAVAFWADRSKFNIVLMTNRADHLAEGGLFRDIIDIFPADYYLAPD